MIFRKSKRGSGERGVKMADWLSGGVLCVKYLNVNGVEAGLLRADVHNLEIVGAEGISQVMEWSDFLKARWDGVKRELRLEFADPSLPLLSFVLAQDCDQRFVLHIRERIERSIVLQLFTVFPSGIEAHGLVRRNFDDSLFTQIFVADILTDADLEAMKNFEYELRQNVGID